MTGHTVAVDEMRSEARPEVYLASPRCSCGWVGRWFLPMEFDHPAEDVRGSDTQAHAAAVTAGRLHVDNV